jgi:hypothetical protein
MAEVQKTQEKFPAKIAGSDFGRLQGGPQDDPQGRGSQIPHSSRTVFYSTPFPPKAPLPNSTQVQTTIFLLWPLIYSKTMDQ